MRFGPVGRIEQEKSEAMSDEPDSARSLLEPVFVTKASLRRRR